MRLNQTDISGHDNRRREMGQGSAMAQKGSSLPPAEREILSRSELTQRIETAQNRGDSERASMLLKQASDYERRWYEQYKERLQSRTEDSTEAA